jgi:hypothetical protein
MAFAPMLFSFGTRDTPFGRLTQPPPSMETVRTPFDTRSPFLTSQGPCRESPPGTTDPLERCSSQHETANLRRRCSDACRKLLGEPRGLRAWMESWKTLMASAKTRSRSRSRPEARTKNGQPTGATKPRTSGFRPTPAAPRLIAGRRVAAGHRRTPDCGDGGRGRSACASARC